MRIRRSIYVFFWRVSGEDPQIVNKARYRLKVRFFTSGITVFLLFWISLYSYHYSFNKLFNLPTLSWLISIAFTMMIINIYRLNIITLNANKLKYSLGYFSSLGIRIFFIILISLTVIKPLELILLNEQVTTEIASIKAEKINSTLKSSELYFNNEIKYLEDELAELQQNIEDQRLSGETGEVDYLTQKIEDLKKNKSTELKEIEILLNESPYFIESLILVNSEYPQIWMLTLILMFVFLSPFILKFTTSPSGYYSKKRFVLQEKIIRDEYEQFKKYYKACFESSLGIPIEIEERFEDPPFNTIRKKDTRTIGQETDFINHLYGAEED
ncbi:DUF4407 domain-containing protein [Winogradskyella tangerina]|uniref:DUF4407 domain-containing protein n=1 Tax=Winogradskyella tangerina TaxID=2023240 RepID=UPI000DBEA76F|nr:DUF4407 domain-containing protein [Winogradskyella tangerina]